MDIGINYPWVDYGWDFGESLFRDANTTPGWVSEIDDALLTFRRSGIKVVRWFILGDGLTYGSRRQVPHAVTNPYGKVEWRFDDPPELGNVFKTNFERLLKKFAQNNRGQRHKIKLMPVLLDFHFCLPGVIAAHKDPVTKQERPDPNWIKKGRSDIIIDPRKSRKFFDRVLDPLLAISRRYRSSIFAWDIFNEPEWVTLEWHPNNQGKKKNEPDLPIRDVQMIAFLNEAIGRVQTASLKATVGFALLETIERNRLFTDYNQFHHYPSGKPENKLKRHRFSPNAPAIVGEFATLSATDKWPDLPSDHQRVIDRLRHIARQGYPLALPWRYHPPPENDRNETRTGSQTDIIQDIQCFTRGTNCP